MAHKHGKPEKSHPHSELLEGTRPANDARLIRDILNADTSHAKPLTRDSKMSLPADIVTVQSSIRSLT